MESYREREIAFLAPYAMFSADSAGREHHEQEHTYRGPFQRDRDRILHSAAFRRLSGKTQVFTGSMGDYHRTRLTHTMEVASIARTLGRALGLNEDLIEAMALLHDIGHPPFGHAGEDALNDCLQNEGGFSHNQFALTLVRELEHPYPRFAGLNLTREVLEGQIGRANKQTRQQTPLLEAQVVDIADSITYDAHDVDDAVKLKLLTIEQLTDIELVADCLRRVEDRWGHLEGKVLRRSLVHELIDYQVGNVVSASSERIERQEFTSAQQARAADVTITTDADMTLRKKELESFLYEQVYRHPLIARGRHRAQSQLRSLFTFYRENKSLLPSKFQRRIEPLGMRRSVADYLAGMTDQFFLQQYEQHIGATH